MADREPGTDVDGTSADTDGGSTPDDQDTGTQTLLETVEAEYDFEDFGPADMAQMSVEEWEAAFDPETWITGPRLIERVEAELRNRVSEGELFAVLERHNFDGEPRLLVYTDAEYVVIHPDGTVEGEGAVRRDVEPVVALCSMESYDVPEPPTDAELPDPSSIQPGSGQLGHRLLLAVAGIQALAGLILLGSPLFARFGPGAGALTTVVGLVFIVIGIFIGVLVANARLSDRFRASEYRERLQAARVGSDDRPSFLPPVDSSDDDSA